MNKCTGKIVQNVRFKIHGDERGKLVAIQAKLDIPFEVKRVYYIFGNIPGVRRGFHAHKSLKQILICVSGSCEIFTDDGTQKNETLLNDPSIGLLIEGPIWREMHDFSPNSVLIVLASEYYDESDYIRDYNKFVEYISRK
jgi:dTDP-4-dehydrorhamnose 3,5-epimerase-like enzyme